MGKPKEQLLGRFINDALPGAEDALWYGILKKVNSDRVKAEKEFHDGDLKKCVYLSATPVADDGVLLIFYNRPDIKKA